MAPEARGFLSIAPVPLPETFEPQTLLGQRLGRYQIVGELGDGGMSTVFLGDRADGQYRQQVAIKLRRYHQGARTAQGDRERAQLPLHRAPGARQHHRVRATGCDREVAGVDRGAQTSLGSRGGLPRQPGAGPSLAGIYAELASLHLAMASKSAATEVQTQHRRRACAYVQESRTHLNRLPNPAAGFGARYPWSASTAETLRRTAEHCDSRGMTPSAHAPEPCRDNSNSNPRAMPS